MEPPFPNFNEGRHNIEIRQISPGNRYLCAAEEMEQDEVILEEKPLISVLERDTKGSGMNTRLLALTDAVLRDPSVYARLMRDHNVATRIVVPMFDENDRKKIQELVTKHGMEKDPGKVFLLLYRININFFECDADGRPSSHEPLGCGYYQSLSFANHSCEPNCAILQGSREDRELRLVTLRRVQPGEPLTFAYSQILEEDAATRRRHLFGMFGFQCECPRCLREIPKGGSPAAADVKTHNVKTS